MRFRSARPRQWEEFRNGSFRKYVITPEDYGFERCKKEDLQGGTPEENAAITRAILQGGKGTEEKRSGSEMQRQA